MPIRPDPDTVNAIIAGSKRFISAYSDPEPYFFYGKRQSADITDSGLLELYYERLRYAVDNADTLVRRAFRESFFDFYGVKREVLSGPAQMCDELMFESFSLDTDNVIINTYLSNERFMRGHYIEVGWNAEWKVEYICIC